MAEKNKLANIIPTMRYDNAKEAIEFLVRAFGFREHLIVPGEGDQIRHAQLTLNNGMVMLGSTRDDTFGRLQKPPKSVGGVGTQSAYIVVSDADAVYEQARKAGAEIVMEITDEEHGGRGFSCRDPEGHLWNFGTYDPWE